MANDAKHPKVGELAIDATDLANVLVDLPPGGLVGLVPARDGLMEVLAEIDANQTTVGGRAGISDVIVEELVTAGSNIARIDELLEPVAKLLEKLRETRAKLEDERYKVIGSIAESVERRATKTGNEDLPAYYEKTLAYRSAPGVIAAKTRAKNEQARLEASTSSTPSNPS